MNSSEPHTRSIPELIPRSMQTKRPGIIANQNRSHQPGGRGLLFGRPTTTPVNLVRLRCPFLPLHDAFMKNGEISQDNADVIFLCGDGSRLKAHKLIMATCSKFFTKLFDGQHANETTVVSVPDANIDVMRLILQLAYRDRVILTMQQIKHAGDFMPTFGMTWSHFGYQPYSVKEHISMPMPAVPVNSSQQSQLVQPIRNKTVLLQQDMKIPDQKDMKTQDHDQDHIGTDGRVTEAQDKIMQIPTSNLGKSESTTNAGNGALKRRVQDADAHVGAPNNPILSSSVSKQSYNEEINDLHTTEKGCRVHEREIHGFSGLNFIQTRTQIIHPQSSPESPNLRECATSKSPKRTKLVMPISTNLQPQQKKPVVRTGIGAQQLNPKKRKRLYWLHVCDRCKKSTHSINKAKLHYSHCFPNNEKPFKDTIVKCRQGFYGNVFCPLCPRHYSQNLGFRIHCGRNHQQYSSLLACKDGDDAELKCNHCMSIFNETTDFHLHLQFNERQNTFYCDKRNSRNFSAK